MLSRSDASYAAGLFEGEGCITLGGNCPRLQISMTDEDVIRRFQQVVGMGTVSGPYAKHGAQYKPFWVWRVSGHAPVQALLAAMWGRLGSRRRRRAQEVLSIGARAPFSPAEINRRKTHCIHGHEFSGNNLVIRAGKRQCRECCNARRRMPGGRGKYQPRLMEKQFEEVS